MSSPQFSYTVKCCDHKDSSMSGGMSEPFQATLLWERIVAHMERTVKTGRHIIALRSHDNCFHGSKAVDCLVPYLNTILPKPVKRTQALVLCTKLFETGVIASVKEKPGFREKGLYRFTRNHFWTTPPTSSDSDELMPSKQVSVCTVSTMCSDPPLRLGSPLAAAWNVYSLHPLNNHSRAMPVTPLLHYPLIHARKRHERSLTTVLTIERDSLILHCSRNISSSPLPNAYTLIALQLLLLLLASQLRVINSSDLCSDHTSLPLDTNRDGLN